MATVATLMTEAIGPFTGISTTPVTLALQATTVRVAFEVRVVTTKVTAPDPRDDMRKDYILNFAFAATGSLTSSSKEIFRGSTKSVPFTCDISLVDQIKTFCVEAQGIHLYAWLEAPSTPYGVVVTVKTTEFAA